LAIAGEQEQPVGDVFRDLLAHIGDEETEHPRAVPWGFADLDHTCGRLQPGTLNVLGGRPSMGKSILADHVSARAAEKGREVALFTYEMPKRDKCIRFAQAKARVNWDRRRQYPGGQDALAEALRGFAALKNLHVFESDYTGSKVAARCKSIATRRGHLDLIVVDFLQRFADMEPSIGKERTDEKLGRLTGLLKRLAKQYDCPVLLLSSLNRGNVNDERRPRMEDLRASGEIESDADVVVLLHASETTPSGGQQRPKEDEIIAVEFNQEKGRNKGTHYCHLTLTKQITRFDNYNP
jgi:replicative DNA helicase